LSRHKHVSEAPVVRIMLTCEHCDQNFELKFESPVAVQCSKCGSVFDARLQMYKQMRKMFQEQVEGGR